jgi:hypothetical protein
MGQVEQDKPSQMAHLNNACLQKVNKLSDKNGIETQATFIVDDESMSV